MTKVSRWMKTNPVTIGADASIMEAIHLMKEKGVRRLPVMKDGKLAGLITDLMIKEYAPGKATTLDTWEVHGILSQTPVSEVMNRSPFTVTPDTELPVAAKLIHDKKLGGLLVVDDTGALAGIMTMTDIMEALIAICESCSNAR